MESMGMGMNQNIAEEEKQPAAKLNVNDIGFGSGGIGVTPGGPYDDNQNNGASNEYIHDPYAGYD